MNTQGNSATAVTIEGAAGPLEARLVSPANPGPCAAVLCHPHPQYGGSMHDGTLDSAASVLNQQNIATLRFNFRGVGASAGSYDAGAGEVDDVRSSAAWLHEQTNSQILLVGYSFGAAMAWAASQTADLPPLAGLWLIAPPVGMFDLAGSNSVPCQVLHPSDDDFTDWATISAWVDGKQNCQLHPVEGANHFFAGATQQLTAALEVALEAALEGALKAAAATRTEGS